jgi:hypothetical protein
MKHLSDADVEWSDWFGTLGYYEKEYWRELRDKCEQAADDIRQFRMEMHRLRQRGASRRRRQLLNGTAR